MPERKTVPAKANESPHPVYTVWNETVGRYEDGTFLASKACVMNRLEKQRRKDVECDYRVVKLIASPAEGEKT